VRFGLPARLIALPAAAALGLGLFTISLGWQVPAAKAGSGALDAQSSELVRLINGARAADGLPALSVDPFLASKARDGAIPCPDDPSKTIAGRTQDYAAFGTMSHQLRLCNSASYALSSTTYVSVLQNTWSYPNVGEINLVNGGYGNGAFLYTHGSWSTWTYSTTGNAMLGWQSSSSHWNIIMGGYDRVGCGGWASGSTYYYECSFSAGGSSPNGLQAPPTSAPYDYAIPTPTLAPPVAPTPVPTAAPIAPAPVQVPAPARTHAPLATADGMGGVQSTLSAASATPTAAAASSPSASVGSSEQAVAAPSLVLSVRGATAAATPGSGPGAALSTGGGKSPSDGASGLAGIIARVVALVSGSGAVLLTGIYLFQALRRRRRFQEVRRRRRERGEGEIPA
jgi:hypothetical protein